MPTNYTFNVNQPGETSIFYSFDDVFVPIDFFSSGNILSWGFNSSGQLGVNNTNLKTSPTDLWYQIYDWRKVSSGYDFAAAIRSDGFMWTWGNNTDGKLGNGTVNSSNVPGSLSSQKNVWKEVSCGFNHMGAIKTDGSLWLWGNGTNGQLGRTITDPSSVPIQESTNNFQWRRLSCGNQYNLAIKNDGTMYAWGLNTYGQLALGNTTTTKTPTQVGSATNWKQIFAGEFHTGAITVDGLLYTCGRNNYGQLGNGSVSANDTGTSSLVSISAGVGYSWKSVSCGSLHTVAIKTDGTMWSWGRNDVGQLGVSGADRSSPVQIGTDINWKQVCCGRYNNVAVKTDGSLWVWGLNGVGQLGLGNTNNQFSPIQIGSSYNWKEAFVTDSNFYAINYNNVYV